MSSSPSLLLRALLLLLVCTTQLLSPLMHGHIGTPRQTGLHVHAAPLRPAHLHADTPSSQGAALASVSVIGDREHHRAACNDEPFEVDVEPGSDPADLPSLAVPDGLLAILSPATFSLLLVLAASVLAVPAVQRGRPTLRWRDLAGHPPPSQAPPLRA